MAQRKKPETTVQLTKNEKKAQSEINKNRTIKQLDEKDFNHYVRFLKKGSLEKIKPVGIALEDALKRLEVNRAGNKAPKGIPEGSDQVDCGTLIRWIQSIETENTEALNQLIALDAICYQRSL